MNLPRSKEIADLFALCREFDNNLKFPCYATPKLNGIRAMWVPKVGFISRDGVPYETGVLPHLEAQFANADCMFDCELYAHGMSLQAINSRAGVVRQKPHSEHALIKAHIFDSPTLGGGFEERMAALAHCGFDALPYKVCECYRTADSIHAGYVSAGFEGTVYKQPGYYRRGRTDAWVKRKAWQDGEFDFVAFLPGEGKYAGTFGAVVLRTSEGKEFCVGSFAFDDMERMAAPSAPRRAKIKFLGYTDQNVPYHSQVLSFEP